MKAVAIGLITGAATTVVDTAAVRVAAVAAGVAGAIYLHRQVIVPFARLIKRALTAYTVLEHLPGWMEGVDERLGRVEATQLQIKEPAEAIARELDVQHRQQPAA